MSAGISKMSSYAVAVVSLAVVVLTGIAVITEFKTSEYIDNDTADKFKSGLVIFGSFLGVLVLGLIAKILIGMFQKND